MANRPEIKIYPVETYPMQDWEHTAGNLTWQQHWNPSHDVERYLLGLIGKSVSVHTSSSGLIRGVVEAVLSEAIVLRTERGQVLIPDWAIVAVESE